jgi:thioredoxin reductase (NADPH)
MYDCAIIGTGAAGVSAALTLNALGKNFIWLGKADLSSKISSPEMIRNYPGLINVSGQQLKEAFLKQIQTLNIPITENRVTGVYALGDRFGILCNQQMYEAKTVILATGVEAVKPIAGELEFVGKGVSYCATCDGFLYKGKTIAVVCTSKQMEHEIEYLCTLAAKVYVFAIYKNAKISAANAQIINGMPKEIEGDKKVSCVTYLKGGESEKVEVDGVFMLKEAVTPSVLVSGLEMKDGQVVVDRNCHTNIDGLFAAGDCTGRPYQYAKAIGEGNISAHSVAEYLAKL